MNIAKPITEHKLLAISIGVVYLWFGLLKFFPGYSPAEDLAKDTINALSFGLVPLKIAINTLALWETLIGVFLIVNFYSRLAVILALCI